MTESIFYSELSKQHHLKLPFVAYRKPKSLGVKALLMQTTELVGHSEDRSGFIFSPFDTLSEAVLFPVEECQELKLDSFSAITDHDNQVLTNQVDASEKARYIELINKTIEAINSTNLKKVVISRKEVVDSQIKPLDLFKRLLSYYSNAFVYCWYHPNIGLWLGATPETLIKIRNGHFKTMALAGTQEFKGEMNVEWGTKEREEQQLVTDEIVANCSQVTNQLKVSEVKTMKAGSLLHLQTLISGTLKTNGQSTSNLIHNLHPTPAVCGLPKDLAKNFIKTNEYYNREFYTGFLGELNMKSDRTRNRNRKNVENNAYHLHSTETNLFVNLRCVKLGNKTASLFVGGGITASSNSEMEWEETVHKSKIIKRLL